MEELWRIFFFEERERKQGEREEKEKRAEKLSKQETKKLETIFLTPSPRIIAPYAEATLARILLDLFFRSI